jgi:hypothetical protein
MKRQNWSAPDAYVNELDEAALAGLPRDVQEMIYQRSVGISARERAAEFGHDREAKRQRAADNVRARQMARELDEQVRSDIRRFGPFGDEPGREYEHVLGADTPGGTGFQASYGALQELVGPERAAGAMAIHRGRYVREEYGERERRANQRQLERNRNRALEDFPFADRLVFAGLAVTDPQYLHDIGIRPEFGNYDPAWDDPAIQWPGPDMM